MGLLKRSCAILVLLALALPVQGARVPVATLDPAEIPDSIVLGETIVVNAHGSNTGDDAASGFIAVAFPDLVDQSRIVGTLADAPVEWVALHPGQEPYGCHYRAASETVGGCPRLVYASIDAGYSEWHASDRHSVEIRVMPDKVGSFRVETKMGLNDGHQWVAWAPGSGPMDQQQEFVQTQTVQVLAEPAPVQKVPLPHNVPAPAALLVIALLGFLASRRRA